MVMGNEEDQPLDICLIAALSWNPGDLSGDGDGRRRRLEGERQWDRN
jgi:hypothetical protein